MRWIKVEDRSLIANENEIASEVKAILSAEIINKTATKKLQSLLPDFINVTQTLTNKIDIPECIKLLDIIESLFIKNKTYNKKLKTELKTLYLQVITVLAHLLTEKSWRLFQEFSASEEFKSEVEKYLKKIEENESKTEQLLEITKETKDEMGEEEVKDYKGKEEVIKSEEASVMQKIFQNSDETSLSVQYNILTKGHNNKKNKGEKNKENSGWLLNLVVAAERWALIAKKCLELGDFATAVNIISALQSNSIQRLIVDRSKGKDLLSNDWKANFLSAQTKELLNRTHHLTKVPSELALNIMVGNVIPHIGAHRHALAFPDHVPIKPPQVVALLESNKSEGEKYHFKNLSYLEDIEWNKEQSYEEKNVEAEQKLLEQLNKQIKKYEKKKDQYMQKIKNDISEQFVVNAELLGNDRLKDDLFELIDKYQDGNKLLEFENEAKNLLPKLKTFDQLRTIIDSLIHSENVNRDKVGMQIYELLSNKFNNMSLEDLIKEIKRPLTNTESQALNLYNNQEPVNKVKTNMVFEYLTGFSNGILSKLSVELLSYSDESRLKPLSKEFYSDLRRVEQQLLQQKTTINYQENYEKLLVDLEAVKDKCNKALTLKSKCKYSNPQELVNKITNFLNRLQTHPVLSDKLTFINNSIHEEKDPFMKEKLIQFQATLEGKIKEDKTRAFSLDLSPKTNEEEANCCLPFFSRKKTRTESPPSEKTPLLKL